MVAGHCSVCVLYVFMKHEIIVECCQSMLGVMHSRRYTNVLSCVCRGGGGYNRRE